MPAGVPWSRYLKFLSASFLCGVAGSQTVHLIYKPLRDFPELVEAEKKRILEEEQQILKQQKAQKTDPTPA